LTATIPHPDEAIPPDDAAPEEEQQDELAYKQNPGTVGHHRNDQPETAVRAASGHDDQGRGSISASQGQRRGAEDGDEHCPRTKKALAGYIRRTVLRDRS
jgi:hypothetical protein